MFGVGASELLILMEILGNTTSLVVILIFPFWMIFRKAGFSGALSLTLLVPILNVFVLLYLAFAKWPALRQLTPSTEPT